LAVNLDKFARRKIFGSLSHLITENPEMAGSD
jgi:hypothetical protein